MKKHEPKYIEVEGIMRACYDSFLKTGNKAYSEIIALADAVPAADVQEVQHGRWVVEAEFKYKRGGRNTEAKQIFGTEWRTMQRLKCSVCGMVVLVDDTIKYEYCPHCGARCEE